MSDLFGPAAVAAPGRLIGALEREIVEAAVMYSTCEERELLLPNRLWGLCAELQRERGTEPARETQVIFFMVFGKPQTAGSKRSFVLTNKKTGDVIRSRATGRPIVNTVDDNPESDAWKGAVAQAARMAYRGPLLTGALEMHVYFYRPRPKNQYGSGRNENVLRADAPPYPTMKPDATKLMRAVEDALTGVIWRDDALVVDPLPHKRWGSPARAEIEIRPMPGCVFTYAPEEGAPS